MGVRFTLALLAGLFAASPSQAYIAISADRLTLSEVMLEFPTILWLTVDRADASRGIFVFNVAETLQGAAPEKPIRQTLLSEAKLPAKLKDLKPGEFIVSFMGSPDNRSLSYFNGVWYLTSPNKDWERFTEFRDDFSAMFVGHQRELAEAVRELTRGRSVVAPYRQKGAPADQKMFVRYDPEFPHRRYPAADPERKEPRTVETLLKDAAARSPAARQQALVELATHADGGSKTLPTFLKAMKDPNADVRMAAAAALAQVNGPAKEVVPALAAALKDSDRFVCSFAAQALVQFGEDAKPALKELRESLGERNPWKDFRPNRACEAAEAILKLAPDSPQAREAVTFLLSKRMLNDQRVNAEGTRTAAARALGRCGAAAKAALPHLQARLKDDVTLTRIAAAEAILLILGGGKERLEAMKTLSTEAAQGELATRLAAIRALGATKQRLALDDLGQLMADKETEISAAYKSAREQAAK